MSSATDKQGPLSSSLRSNQSSSALPNSILSFYVRPLSFSHRSTNISHVQLLPLTFDSHKRATCISCSFLAPFSIWKKNIPLPVLDFAWLQHRAQLHAPNLLATHPLQSKFLLSDKDPTQPSIQHGVQHLLKNFRSDKHHDSGFHSRKLY